MKPISWKEARKITMDEMLAMEARREGSMEMDERTKEFVAKLVAQHRTVTEKDTMAYGEQYRKQCSACDGHTWQIWRPGDAVYECAFWIEARELGLLPVGLE